VKRLVRLYCLDDRLLIKNRTSPSEGCHRKLLFGEAIRADCAPGIWRSQVLMPLQESSLLLRRYPRKLETLVGQIRRNGEAYPANPNWHDNVFHRYMPAKEETKRVAESYQ
jgi:hypothetical protein